MRLTGQTVLITGGASGIGLALAEKLVRRGNGVIIVGRDERKLEEARLRLPEAVAYRCDIGSEKELSELVELIQNRHSELSLLVNNAGIQQEIQIGSMSSDGLSERIGGEVRVNFIAPAQLCHLLMPLLACRKESGIVNVTSALTYAPKKSAPVYGATKAALSSFTRALRYQTEGTAVRIFEAVPPLVDTPMTAGRSGGMLSPEQFAEAVLRGIESNRPIIRVGKSRLLYMIYRLAPRLAYRILKNS